MGNMTMQRAFKITLAVLAALATGYALFMSVNVLVLLLLAMIIASAVRPLVGRLVRWRVPEGAAILLIYVGALLFTFIILVALLPPLVNQAADYMQSDARLANRILIARNFLEFNLSRITGEEVALADTETIREAVADVVQQLRDSAPTLAGSASDALGDLVLVIVMGIYWLASRDKAIRFITRLSASEHRENSEAALLEIEESLGSYTRGLIFIALFVGIANFIVLSLLGVNSAATYAFILGITSILPIVGGLVGGVLAVGFALLVSPANALVVFVVFFIIQQIEAHVLSPRVMARSISVDPLLVLVAIFVGFALYGVMGGIISIPILSTISVLLRRFVVEPRAEQVTAYAVEGGVPIFKTNGGEVESM